MLLGEPDGDGGRQLGVDLVGLELGLERDAELPPERGEHVLLGAGPPLDEDLAQTAPLLALRRARLLEHLGRQARAGHTPDRLEQHVAEPLSGHGRTSSPG